MRRGSREMLSVGIDVGTTTAQVVFSRLEVADAARPGRVPQFNVTAKSLLYQSPIVFTPLLSPDEVDAAALTEIIRKEYRAAGVKPAQVETGAVIITGEIARAKNAAKILTAVSQLAGDFVVAAAGPNVEAQIAGRGSGAAAYSVAQFSQVTNVDIGGGTANAAIFRVGDHVASAALAVGGRQIIVERATGMVRHVAPPGQKIIEALGLPLYPGRRAEGDALQRFTDCMAELVVDLVTGEETELGRQLQLSGPLAATEASRALFLSGGVGAYYYNPPPINSLADALLHDDVGPLLAQSLRRNRRLQKMRIEPPAQTTRATVMGASSQTVKLSGSTIWAEERALPLRNLPVIRPLLTGTPLHSPDKLSEAVEAALRRWDIDRRAAAYAIALDLPRRLDFPSLRRMAEGLAHFAGRRLPAGAPLTLVTELDYALVLGQTLKPLLPQRPLVVIDQVGLGEGDFIDIGKPIFGGRVVPLSVKTLIFY